MNFSSKKMWAMAGMASLVSTCTATGNQTANAKGKTNPNVIFILADDWGYGDVKCLGGDSCKIETPNMDKLAGEGMVFTNAHSSSAVSTPTRYGIITGRYNWRSRLKEHVLWGFSPRLIEEGRQTVPGFMANNGYKTACFGKWHMGMNMPTLDGKAPRGQDLRRAAVGKPLKPGATNIDWKGTIKGGPVDVGFDHFYGISASLDMPPYIWINDNKFEGEATTVKAFQRPGAAHKDFKAVDVLGTIAKKSVEYIHANKEKPLFMYIALNSPHTPIVPSKEWKGKSEIGPYGDFVMETDWAVGQVVKAVDDAGLSENTLIIVTADNGCSPAARTGSRQLVFNGAKKQPIKPNKHYPCDIYRGHKADIYEGGHRVPFIARWKGKVVAGSKCDDTVCLTDLYATCAELLGKKLSDNEAEDSVSFVPNLLGTAKGHLREATIHHSINGSFAIRQGKWKLALCPGSGGWSAPTPGGGKRKVAAIKQWVQLFDLETDPSETNNLADKNPETVKRLTSLVQQYILDGRSTPGAKQKNTGETHMLPTWIRNAKNK